MTFTNLDSPDTQNKRNKKNERIVSSESVDFDQTPHELRGQQVKLMEQPEITWKDEAYSIFRLALPSIITNALTSSMAIVDLLMVGHLGTDELAAAALATTYFSFFFSFMIGVSFAMEALGSQAFGAKDFVALNKYFRQGFVVVTMFLILFSGCLSVAGPLSKYVLLQPDNISEMVSNFDFTLIPGLWTFSYYQILTKYLQVQNIMRPPLIINLIGNILNGFSAYGLIYYFDFGIHGAPLATTISRTAMFILIYFYIVYIQRSARDYPLEENDSLLHEEASDTSDDDKARLLSESEGGNPEEEDDDEDSLRYIQNPEQLFIYSQHYFKQTFQWRPIMRLFRMAISGGIMTSVEALSFEITTFEAGYLSTESLAAHQICLTATTFTYMTFPLGLSIAGGIRIGNLLGANRPKQAKKSSRILVVMGASLMVVIIVAYASAGEYLGRAFSSDEVVIDKVKTVIYIICLFQLSDGIQATCAAVLRGLARLATILKISLLGLWFLGVPVGAVFAFVVGLDIDGLWLGFVTGLSVSNILSFFILSKINWEEESLKALRNLRNSSKGSVSDAPPAPASFISSLSPDETLWDIRGRKDTGSLKDESLGSSGGSGDPNPRLWVSQE